MSQGSNTVTMTGNCGSNAQMTNDLRNGMAFAISSWSTYDSWLWKNRCSAGGCNGSDIYFKNLVIKTGGSTPGPSPGPTPTPGNYTYGDACASKSADECNGSCDCRWSWPSDDPAKWSSRNAHCRCKN